MKLTRQRLRQVILAEIFEKDAKFYKYTHSRDGRQHDLPETHMFQFETDGGLRYTVLIYAPRIFGYGSDPMFKGVWDVSFSAQDPKDSDRDAYGLTGKNDMKVLNTIIQIVKYFVSNVRPTLPDKLATIVDFKCEASQESGIPEGDDRRGRIYQYMLRKQGIASKLRSDREGKIILEFTI